jgi:hypothetical protein
MGRACLYPSPYQTLRQKPENLQDFTEALTRSHTGRHARIGARIGVEKSQQKLVKG